MHPLYYNSIIAVLSLIYVFAVVGIMDAFVRKGFPQDISRKIVHIAAASWLLFWVFYDTDHWSCYFNILPAFVWFVLLLYKGFFASPDDDAVKTMTRTGDRRELLRGPLYFTVVMNIMGTIFFMTPLAVVSMGILGWGDGLAPLFGKKYGRHKYNFVTEKSYEGSISFLLFAIFGASLFSWVIFGNIPLITIVILSVISTIVEALSPRDLDNIFIPVVCIIFFLFIL